MNLLILNPNSTASMTETIAVAARKSALQSTVITAVSGADPAPASV